MQSLCSLKYGFVRVAANKISLVLVVCSSCCAALRAGLRAKTKRVRAKTPRTPRMQSLCSLKYGFVRVAANKISLVLVVCCAARRSPRKNKMGASKNAENAKSVQSSRRKRAARQFGRLVVTPVELANLSSTTRPADFPEGLLYVGQPVYEVNEPYKSERNPFAVGDCFGIVTGSVLDTTIDVDWAGDDEAVLKTNLKAAPPVGTTFYWDQDKQKKQQYVIGEYVNGDCVIWHHDPKQAPAKGRRRLRRLRGEISPEVSWCTPELGKKSASKTKSNKSEQKPASKKADQEPEEEPASTAKKPRKAGLKWKRCRAVALSSEELATFNSVMKSVEVSGTPVQVYEAFALRVCREYKSLQDSPLHLNRSKIIKAAITQVFAQVRGTSPVPHDGDATEAFAVLSPVVEKVTSILAVIYLC